MRIKRRASLLLVILMLLPFAVSQATGTLVTDGKVKNGVFSNSMGISFTMPEGYTAYFQTIRGEGFLRIMIHPDLNKQSSFLLDFREGPVDLEAFGEEEYLYELVNFPITVNLPRHSPYLLAFSLLDKNGIKEQQTLGSYKFRENNPKTRMFVYSNAWCTDTYYVRISLVNENRYSETFIQGLADFNTLRDSLSVP